MLKNLGYYGAYHDENISVGILLENPLKYGLEASELVFSVTLRSNKGGTLIPCIEDFTFYVMDEANRLYNTRSTPCLSLEVEAITNDDEPMRQPDGLISTDFKHAFIFQDLRLAFYYRPYGEINMIDLKH